MAFSVGDFQDLLRLLREHPEWRAELRRELLPDELLELPLVVARLAAAGERTDQRLELVAQRLDQLTERVDQLAERMDQLTERVDQLAAQLDQLTERVDQLAERMDQLTERVDQLAARLDQLTERVDQLAARLDQLTERVDQLAARLDQLTERVDQFAASVEARFELIDRRFDRVDARFDLVERRLGTLEDNVGDLRERVVEFDYERHAGAYFSSLARRLRLIPSTQLADLLDEAADQGVLTDAEREAIMRADLVLEGRRRADHEPIYLVVEVSAGIGRGDVERAAARAAMLARLGRPTIPLVAGQRIDPDAQTLSAERGVVAVLDGRTAG